MLPARRRASCYSQLTAATLVLITLALLARSMQSSLLDHSVKSVPGERLNSSKALKSPRPDSNQTKLTPPSTVSEPPPAAAKIPRRLHQTWKTSNLSLVAEHEPERRQWFATWVDMNPDYVHVLRDDAASDEFVAARFPGRVAAAYNRLPLRVQKTDLYRYLVLLDEGGVYVDADTACLKPIDRWWPTDGAPVEFVAGLEWDTEPGTVGLQLCQWAMAAAPGHPILRALVDRIVARIETASDADLVDVDRVIDLTGPLPWTLEVAQYLKGMRVDLQRAVNDNGGCRAGHLRFKEVVVLGITAFSPYHPRAGGFGHPDACVNHKFAGGWNGGWKKSGAAKRP
ncbi:hypothetical protein DFJ73DRAFT_623407 [Zopfochytrium polystomum]|nr:hypothetical protein DFJ73DRAFT_623407 [Zopfochytrium polystomum]